MSVHSNFYYAYIFYLILGFWVFSFNYYFFNVSAIHVKKKTNNLVITNNCNNYPTKFLK